MSSQPWIYWEQLLNKISEANMKQDSYNEWKWMNSRKPVQNHFSLRYCSVIMHNTDPVFLSPPCLPTDNSMLGIWTATGNWNLAFDRDSFNNSACRSCLAQPQGCVTDVTSEAFILIFQFIFHRLCMQSCFGFPLCKWFLQCPFTIVKLWLFQH